MNVSKYAPPFNNPEYTRGFEEGQRHTAPSAETTRRLNELSDAIKIIPDIYTKMTVLDERTKIILEKIGDSNKDIEKLDTRVTDIERQQSSIMTKVGIFASFISVAVTSIIAAVVNKII